MNIPDAISKAQDYIRLGNNRAARDLLRKVLAEDRKNEEAWLLFAKAAETPKHEAQCLEKVLWINPQNTYALQRKEQVSLFIAEKKKHLSLSWKLLLVSGLSICFLGVMIFGCYGIYQFVLPGILAPQATPVPDVKPVGPLHELLLSRSYISNILGIYGTTYIQEENSCANSHALECAEMGFVSNAGDSFHLSLERFGSKKEACDYGIGLNLSLNQKYHTTDLDFPTTVGNYRWLTQGFVYAAPVYYGGACENGIEAFSFWSRSDPPILEEEAIQMFSQLLDAQIAVLRQGVKTNNVFTEASVSTSFQTPFPNFLATDTNTPFPVNTNTPLPLPTMTSYPNENTIVIDDWEISVDKVLMATSITSTVSGSMEKAAGRFALVFIHVTNRGLHPRTFVGDGILAVRDTEGNLYEENIMATVYAMDKYDTDSGANINPDATEYVVSVFDISLKSAWYALVPGPLAPNTGVQLLLNIPA
jgi:hypothetical protein